MLELEMKVVVLFDLVLAWRQQARERLETG